MWFEKVISYIWYFFYNKFRKTDIVVDDYETTTYLFEMDE